MLAKGKLFLRRGLHRVPGFGNFIVNNKDSLYNALNLDTLKKNKDSSVMYGKKLYYTERFDDL